MELTTHNDVVNAELVSLIQDAAQYAASARATNTVKAYNSDWNTFQRFCDERGLCSMPASPEVLVVYITHLADGHKTSSISRALSSIKYFHKKANLECDMSSTVLSDVWEGIRRTLGSRKKGVDALTVADLGKIAQTFDTSLVGRRDKAMVLLGFAGAFRRSEVVALRFEDVEFSDKGALILLRRSKGDQAAEGMVKAIPYARDENSCAVRALKEWIAVAGMKEGLLFRRITTNGKGASKAGISDQVLYNTVVNAAKKAGVSGRISTHSLRAGLATSAAMNGVPIHDIMRHTGHKSVEVCMQYVRVAEAWKGNAAAAVL